MKKIIAVFLLLSVGILSARTLYVDKNHVQANDANPGTADLPWLTIQKAATDLGPGDTAVVEAGDYGENVATTKDGAPGSRIVFMAQDTVVTQRFFLRHDYITISGFTFRGYESNYDENVRIVGSHLTIVNNTFNNEYANVYAIQTPYFAPLPDSILIRDNTFDRHSSYIIMFTATNSLIENNLFKDNINGCDALRIFGHDITIRGNTFLRISEMGAVHTDIIQTYGIDSVDAYNVIFENNLVRDCDAQIGNLEHDYSPGVHHWTFRNNVFVNIKYALNIGIPYVYVYNNTFYNSNWGNDSHSIYFLFNSTFIKNNLFISSDKNSAGWYGTDSTAYTADYNYIASLAPGFLPKTVGAVGAYNGFVETHGINGGDPRFTDLANFDFSLLSGSPAIDQGTDLSSEFTIDYDGLTRPQGSEWDIGAYEYAAVGFRRPDSPGTQAVRPQDENKDLPNPFSLADLSSVLGSRFLVYNLYDLNGHLLDPDRITSGGVYLLRAGGNGVLYRITILP